MNMKNPHAPNTVKVLRARSDGDCNVWITTSRIVTLMTNNNNNKIKINDMEYIHCNNFCGKLNIVVTFGRVKCDV